MTFGSKRRILFAEDSTVQRTIIQTIMVSFGYEFEIAGDGLEAFEMFQDHGPYDLIFMDINMPKMGGMEAVRRIRKSDLPGADAPIIALTAGDHITREHCLAAGMNDFLVKPIDPRQLLASIDNHLSTAAGGAAQSVSSNILPNSASDDRDRLAADIRDGIRAIKQLAASEHSPVAATEIVNRVMIATETAIETAAVAQDEILAVLSEPAMTEVSDFAPGLRKIEAQAQSTIVAIERLRAEYDQLDGVLQSLRSLQTKIDKLSDFDQDAEAHVYPIAYPAA